MEATIITTGDFVSEVHMIAHRDCNLIHQEGGWYWKHWASALAPEESELFTKFYNMDLGRANANGWYSQVDNYDLQAIEKYRNTLKRMKKGKKYDAYTGVPLTKNRSEQYIHLLRLASRYYQ